ncbi:MAG: transcriptional regulator with XRE-family HTH domain [Saprospiraceae bacterium]|jgi:transcriptional regulator with XRE-family HTH domain
MATTKNKTKNIPQPTNFGKNLKFLRRMKGLSQTGLANEVGLSRNNIASYESGFVEPNMKKFLATCQYFNVVPKDMLESILSEHPTNVTAVSEETPGIVDKHLNEQLEQFVIQTNEMTKVFEGYQAFFEMRKETETYRKSKELFSTLEDLLELLQALIGSNWKLIQSVYPDTESDAEMIDD